MKICKFFLWVCLIVAIPAHADSLFFEDEPVQGGLNVFEVSQTFADIYQKLDGIKWAGKNINIAVESLEKLNTHAHIAATDERVVLVWDDNIIANYPRPSAGDWNGFGEITTALILKMRENDATLRRASVSELYQRTVAALMRGIDESGRYIYSRSAEIADDNRMLTSVGMTGARDARGNWRVTGVFKGGPADNAGINAGDLISEINGLTVANIDDDTLAAMMDGYNSGTIKARLLTPAGARNIVLRRASVVLADADIVYRATSDTDGILDIIVHRITDNAVNIISESLKKYSTTSGIILDLRNAGGDNPRAAARLAGMFIGARPVMRIVETAMDEVEVIPSAAAITDAPIVVLLSNQTRGTAEAVAYSIYDAGRGVLVGTPTAGDARIATRIELNNGGALELMNKLIKTGTGGVLDGRGVFPLVCLSNIRTDAQQDAFFLNVLNNDFNAKDYNRDSSVSVADIRRGCPVIVSGTDEDASAAAVAVKILTDKVAYGRLVADK